MTEDKSETRMNLVAIQKVDPYAKSIVFSSSHVAYYRFIKGEWEKTEIEGTLFVYHRLADPKYSIFINNRLNTNSLVEPITKNIELQSQPPFLLVRNERSKINGFWFYNKLDCDKIYELLDKIINDCHPKPENVKNSVFPPQNGNGHSENSNGENPKPVDIFSMLSKAQHEFNNNNSNGATNNVHGKPQQQQQFAPMLISQQRPQGPPPLVPQIPIQAKPRNNLTAAMPDITSPNVVKFFAVAAQQPNGKINDNGVSPFPKQLPVHPNVHSLQDHNKPPVHTVDEIEKLHRLSTGTPPTNVEKSQSKISHEVEQTPLSTFLNMNAVSLQANNTVHVTNQKKLPLSPQPIKLTSATAGGFNVLNMSKLEKEQPLTKPTLMPPTMFLANNVDDPTLFAPVKPDPLTQNQLLQAINYLLETDSDFMRKLHEAYLKSYRNVSV